MANAGQLLTIDRIEGSWAATRTLAGESISNAQIDVGDRAAERAVQVRYCEDRDWHHPRVPW